MCIRDSSYRLDYVKTLKRNMVSGFLLCVFLIAEMCIRDRTMSGVVGESV